MTFSQNKTSKVIFWNIWGHRNPEELHQLLKQHASETDVFCLTEVTDIDASELAQLETVLRHGENPLEKPQHVNGFVQLQALFAETHDLQYESATRTDWTCQKTAVLFPAVGFGSALIICKELDVVATGFEIIGNTDGVQPRIIQWVIYDKNEMRYLVAHLHGVWIKENTKGDHPVRDLQSEYVRATLEGLRQEYRAQKIIFGGDLNLDMQTKALRALESGAGVSDQVLRNLISEFNVSGTRTAAYRKFNEPGALFADYVLVSNEVIVDSLVVLTEELASDHAPLIVNFS